MISGKVFIFFPSISEYVEFYRIYYSILANSMESFHLLTLLSWTASRSSLTGLAIEYCVDKFALRAPLNHAIKPTPAAIKNNFSITILAAYCKPRYLS